MPRNRHPAGRCAASGIYRRIQIACPVDDDGRGHGTGRISEKTRPSAKRIDPVSGTPVQPEQPFQLGVAAIRVPFLSIAPGINCRTQSAEAEANGYDRLLLAAVHHDRRCKPFPPHPQPGTRRFLTQEATGTPKSETFQVPEASQTFQDTLERFLTAIAATKFNLTKKVLSKVGKGFNFLNKAIQFPKKNDPIYVST